MPLIVKITISGASTLSIPKKRYFDKKFLNKHAKKD